MKIRDDVENIQKGTLVWFIHSVTQNAMHVWSVKKKYSKKCIFVSSQNYQLLNGLFNNSAH